MRIEVNKVTEIMILMNLYVGDSVTVHQKSRHLWKDQAAIVLNRFQLQKNHWNALSLEHFVLKADFVQLHEIHGTQIYRKMEEYGDQEHLELIILSLRKYIRRWSVPFILVVISWSRSLGSGSPDQGFSSWVQRVLRQHCVELYLVKILKRIFAFLLFCLC